MYYFDNKFEKEVLAKYPDYKIRVNRHNDDVDSEKTVSISVVDKFGNTIETFDRATYEELGIYGSWMAMDHVESYIPDEMIICRMKIYDNVSRNWSVGVKIESLMRHDDFLTFFAIDEAANIHTIVRDRHISDIYREHNAAIYVAIYYYIYGDKNNLPFPMMKIDEMPLLKPIVSFDGRGVSIKTTPVSDDYYYFSKLGYTKELAANIIEKYPTSEEIIEEVFARADLHKYMELHDVQFTYQPFNPRRIRIFAGAKKTRGSTNEAFCYEDVFEKISKVVSPSMPMDIMFQLVALYLGYWYRRSHDSGYKGSKNELILKKEFAVIDEITPEVNVYAFKEEE